MPSCASVRTVFEPWGDANVLAPNAVIANIAITSPIPKVPIDACAIVGLLYRQIAPSSAWADQYTLTVVPDLDRAAFLGRSLPNNISVPCDSLPRCPDWLAEGYCSTVQCAEVSCCRRSRSCVCRSRIADCTSFGCRWRFHRRHGLRVLIRIIVHCICNPHGW